MYKPSLDFFVLKDVDVYGMKNMRGWFLPTPSHPQKEEGDIAGTKMKKLFDFFVRELGRKGQVVLRKEFDYSGIGQKAVGYIVVKEVKEIEVRGPPVRGVGLRGVGVSGAVKAYRKVKKNAFVKKGFWWARVSSGVDEVFDLVKKVEGERGAFGKIV